ncbi:MAG: zinc dependent phospholipase C family protein [Bacteroidia bacterium]
MLKKVLFLSVIILFISFLIPQQSHSWGFFAHKRINRMAVFTLPPSMIGFYKKHIEFITEHAVDPDKRRYAVEDEAPRHYIDIDRYAKDGEDPFKNMPRKWKDAVAKFTEDTLKAHGIVPWWIETMVKRLTEAFRNEDLDRILRYSADLGHYIGDAHVPLHTTENYNGQLTNQKGIHGFWESRLPELFAEDYDYWTGRAKYIEHPLDYAWDRVQESFAAKDSVLLMEAQLNAVFPSDKKYSYENRGAAMMKVYSYEYSAEYNKMMNGMVERRMRSAITGIGSLWYTAWVNAGQPDLSRLDNKEITEQLKKEQEEEEKMWKTGIIKNAKGHEE